MKRLRLFSYPYWGWMAVLILVPTLILVVLAFSDLSVYDPAPFNFTLDHFESFPKVT